MSSGGGNDDDSKEKARPLDGSRLAFHWKAADDGAFAALLTLKVRRRDIAARRIVVRHISWSMVKSIEALSRYGIDKTVCVCVCFVTLISHYHTRGNINFLIAGI